MREPERIDRILGKLGRLWHLAPDQRLGQLLENYVFPSGELRGESTAWMFQQGDLATEEILDAALGDHEKIESFYLKDPERVRRILESHGYDVTAPYNKPRG